MKDVHRIECSNMVTFTTLETLKRLLLEAGVEHRGCRYELVFIDAKPYMFDEIVYMANVGYILKDKPCVSGLLSVAGYEAQLRRSNTPEETIRRNAAVIRDYLGRRDEAL